MPNKSSPNRKAPSKTPALKVNFKGRLGKGRRRARDPRDAMYAMLKPVALPDIWRKEWATGSSHAWDQGATSMCVSFSTNRYLISSPVRNSISQRILPEWLIRFYKQCQRTDEWEGEDYDGTSVRAAFALLKAIGYISEYRWAFDTDTILNHVLTVGPVVVGTDWTAPMERVDARGFIRVHDEAGRYVVAGGHAYLICGADRRRKCPDGTTGAFLIQNSWGDAWGFDHGKAWVSIAEFAELLKNGGDAAVATEILKPFRLDDLPKAA